MEEDEFYSDVAKCLYRDPVAKARLPTWAVGIVLYPVTIIRYSCE